jgi:hypothetical protein
VRSLVIFTAVKVLDLLTEGKRSLLLQHPRSSRDVEEFIAERKPDTLMKVYNASREHGSAQRGHGVGEVRPAIYSPSISSGVSFVSEL